MKTIKESILSSTNTGKNRKIDVEYLLKHGFETDFSFGLKNMFKHKETGYSLRTFRDKIVFDILKPDNSSLKHLVVSTVEDLDLVTEWFKARRYKDSNSEKEKLKKELFKNLKEL